MFMSQPSYIILLLIMSSEATHPETTESWKIHEYGGSDNLKLETIKFPTITDPNEVLIKVKAASINPIDSLMIEGYGRTIFQFERKFQSPLPLTLGRDFCGVIIEKGANVKDKFQVGDEVYGFIPVHKQGTFSRYILADFAHIQPKPKTLDFVQSASLVYAAMTAWSALFRTNYLETNHKGGEKVLVLGGSGGVGTLAIQLLKSQGYTVHTTCSTNAIPLVTKLGADVAYDYRKEDFEKEVGDGGRYKLILDCVATDVDKIPENWKYDVFVTLNSPLLHNTDNRGIFLGLLSSGANLLWANLTRLKSGSRVKWGFFNPSPVGFKFLHDLIVDNKIQPVLHQVVGFNELPKAFEVLKAGHSRGKVVINYDN